MIRGYSLRFIKYNYDCYVSIMRQRHSDTNEEDMALQRMNLELCGYYRTKCIMDIESSYFHFDYC